MQFPTNWELSTARATEVIKYLISEVKLPPQLLSAVGRADTAPVAGNDSEEGRKQNRRIEIILLPPEGVPHNVASS
jgi:chemotaxis protein MotB